MNQTAEPTTKLHRNPWTRRLSRRSRRCIPWLLLLPVPSTIRLTRITWDSRISSTDLYHTVLARVGGTRYLSDLDIRSRDELCSRTRSLSATVDLVNVQHHILLIIKCKRSTTRCIASSEDKSTQIVYVLSIRVEFKMKLRRLTR